MFATGGLSEMHQMLNLVACLMIGKLTPFVGSDWQCEHGSG